eukprot:scaffold14401_cov59-Attheya_sp.AAC.2
MPSSRHDRRGDDETIKGTRASKSRRSFRRRSDICMKRVEDPFDQRDPKGMQKPQPKSSYPSKKIGDPSKPKKKLSEKEKNLVRNVFHKLFGRKETEKPPVHRSSQKPEKENKGHSKRLSTKSVPDATRQRHAQRRGSICMKNVPDVHLSSEQCRKSKAVRSASEAQVGYKSSNTRKRYSTQQSSTRRFSCDTASETSYTPRQSRRASRSMSLKSRSSTCDEDVWVEIEVITKRNKKKGQQKLRSLYYSLNTKKAQWDEAPSGAGRVITRQEFLDDECSVSSNQAVAGVRGRRETYMPGAYYTNHWDY